MKPGTFKDIEIGPLDGLFDARTKSGSLPAAAFRVVLNMDRSEAHNHCRLGGWKKLLSDTPFGFKNQDFHDQMLDCNFYVEQYSDTICVPAVEVDVLYPYWHPGTPVQGNIPLTFNDHAISNSVTGTNINWNRPHVLNGLSYLTAMENNYGASQDITDARTFLNTIYIPATNDTNDTQGTFSGTVGNVTYSYTLEYDSENHQWLTDYTFNVPDFAYTSYETDGYEYGTQISVLSEAYCYDYSYCQEQEYVRAGCREPITLIHEFTTAAGRRRLLIGAKSKLAVLNERGGNWRIIADGLGGNYSEDTNCDCSSRRFRVAQIGQIMVITNDYDPLLFWPMDAGPTGCDFWSAEYVTDLLTLNITKAHVVAAWNGYVFIANVEQENERHPNRIFWSDFNNPLSWIPAANSDANSQDLGLGERIIRAETIGGRLLLYTKKNPVEYGIYEVRLIGGDAVFAFAELYRGPDGVEYENSLINLGDRHYWLSQSGIMEMTEFDRAPHRIEWMHRADGVFYKGLEDEWLKSFPGLDGFGSVNKDACEQVIGFYDSERRALWFSWPTDDNECPNMSLRLNLAYEHASLVDHGFTAGAMHKPDYTEALRDWLAEEAGCDPLDLLMDKEGVPYSYDHPTEPPAYIRNETEDPDLAADPDSLCARVAGTDINDLCNACDADAILILADASDRTLKEFTPDTYYRERYINEGVTYNCPQTTPGDYALDGYYSMLQGDAMAFGQKAEKLINRSEVDYVAEEQTVPNDLTFHVGYGQQPRCLTWDTTAADQQLKCLTENSAAQHAANNTRPSLLATYNYYRRGVYISWRMYTSGTGGASCFNGVTLSVRLVQGQWR